MHVPRLLVGLIAVIAGLCVGRASGQRELASLQLAELHLSAIITVQQWLKLAYDGPGSTQCVPESPSLTAPSTGGRHLLDCTSQSFTNPDGSYGTLTVCDRSFTVEISYPGGRHETIVGKASDRLPQGCDEPQRFDVVHWLSTQGKPPTERARYVRTTQFQFRPRDSANAQCALNNVPVGFIFEGAFVLADGARSRFRLVQPRPSNQDEYLDVLDLEIPGGERLHWEIPIIKGCRRVEGVNLNDLLVPDFASKPAAGSYTARGRAVGFVLRGGPQTLDWRLFDGRGLQGQFTLRPDFSGQGRAQRGNRLEFVGRWDSRGQATLLLADGQAAVAGPSAGAQDFGTGLLRSLILTFGPYRTVVTW